MLLLSLGHSSTPSGGVGHHDHVGIAAEPLGHDERRRWSCGRFRPYPGRPCWCRRTPACRRGSIGCPATGKRGRTRCGVVVGVPWLITSNSTNIACPASTCGGTAIESTRRSGRSQVSTTIAASSVSELLLHCPCSYSEFAHWSSRRPGSGLGCATASGPARSGCSSGRRPQACCRRIRPAVWTAQLGSPTLRRCTVSLHAPPASPPPTFCTVQRTSINAPSMAVTGTVTSLTVRSGGVVSETATPDDTRSLFWPYTELEDPSGHDDGVVGTLQAIRQHDRAASRVAAAGAKAPM